jgi:hypothetical protein
VLSGFDLARWRPRLILLEDHVANLNKHRFLRNAGYRLIRRFEYNGWYVPREANVRVASPDRWEIVRKYYLGLPFRIARNASRRVRQPFKDRRRLRPESNSHLERKSVGSFWSCPVFIAHQLSASGFSSLAGSEAVDGPAAMRLSRCRGDNFFLSWRFLCST